MDHHDHNDAPLIQSLRCVIRFAVRVLALLIAIEIFVNIYIYLKENVIHVQIVMATALMAIARKIIILDFNKICNGF